jgi:DNA-binding MarR family transcriptional regulator
VAHLIDLGLVERTPDPDDGRATLLTVTAEGTRRLKDVADDRRKWLDEQLGDWSESELSAFVSELARYNAALSES